MNRPTVMNEVTNLTLALLAGLSLGAMFFGGLWWTVRQGMSAKHPALWLFGSVMLRMGAALAGFYFVGRDDWERLVVCLVGFILARAVVMGTTTPRQDRMRQQAEVGHAPDA
jgi:F1F0 ATPase subunit 2